MNICGFLFTPDLVRVQNITLTESQKEGLVNATTHFLIDKPSEDFRHFARSLLSKENILEIFEAKPTFAYPVAYNERYDRTPTFEILSSKLNGYYKTPGFGKYGSCNKTIQNVHFLLQLPLVVMKEADDAVLDIQIEIQSNNDWLIQFREGRRYIVYSEMSYKKSWQDAESFCKGKGGHLASVKNIVDREELGTSTLKTKTWIGGTDRAVEDAWVWPDGTPLGERACSTIDYEKGDLLQPCNQWASTNPKGGTAKNCMYVLQGAWHSDDCSYRNNFACQNDPSFMKANRNLTLKMGDVKFYTVEVWLKKRANYKTKTCDTLTSLPGFSVSWKTRKDDRTSSSQTFDVGKVLEKIHGSKNHIKVYTLRRYMAYVTKIVRHSIVHRSKQYNMSNAEIWDMVKSWKREVIRKKLAKCEDSNVVAPDFFNDVFKGLLTKIPSDRSKVSYKETNDDLFLSFDIFSYMIFCQNEAMGLQIFLENLVRTRNTPSILQGVMNTAKLDFEEDSVNKAQQYIFKGLNAMLDLKLSQVLKAMYDSESIETATKKNKQNLDNGLEILKLNRTDMERAASMSNHPVAIYDREGQIQPSAFIPFCSFGAKMMGPEVPNMTFPICDIFEPTVYEGHLCYQVNAEKGRGQTVFEGKESGLMLLIDVNSERSFDIATEDQHKGNDKSVRDVYLGQARTENKNVNLANIHIGTLAQYTGQAPGDFALTAIKEMTGSENFLAWPEDKRKCALEKYEKCQMKGFLEESMKCGCSPFQLLPAKGSTDQVAFLEIISQL